MKKFLTFNIFTETLFVSTTFVLPLIAFFAELSLEMSAQQLSYNPMPTLAHKLTIFLIPCILLAWKFQRDSGKDISSPLWRITLGAIASSSFIFGIPFIPLLPFAVILMIIGFGFLFFAPFCTAVAALYGIWVAYRIEKEKTDQRGWRSKLPWGSMGLLLGFLFMVGISFPEAQINQALNVAKELSNNNQRVEAIKILRRVDDEHLRRAICEYKRVRSPDPLHLFTAPGMDVSFQYYDSHLYWNATGKPCGPNLWGRDARLIPRRDDQTGIALQTSRFDASIDAKAATAYNEWTFEVKNTDTRRREADFIVQLPPGSVVSRVTLWVNGEPREATFAGRGKATKAYEAVVRKAKDPILVSEVGPDRIRVRMFPLLVDKTMKARLGITTPLQLSEKNNLFRFPKIIAGNVAPIKSHRVWVESKDSIRSDDLNAKIVDGAYQIRGDLNDAQLSTTKILSPFFQVKSVSANPNAGAQTQLFSTQTFKIKTPEAKNLIFLIDGGIKMKNQKHALIASIKTLQSKSTVSLFINDDGGPRKLIDRKLLSSQTKTTFIEALSGFEFIGGRDNTSGLNKTQIFSKMDNDIIIWIHASQPVAFRESLNLDTYHTPIYELQIDGERDLNVEKLNIEGALSPIPRYGNIEDDLIAFFSSLNAPTMQREIAFGKPEGPEDRDHVSSSHLYRLAARDEINRLTIDPHDLPNHSAAIQLAHETQIVTRVSAAVVLETRDQYQRHGLDQANGQGVPTIPEPEEWALIIIMSLFLIIVVWKRRNEDNSMELI